MSIKYISCCYILSNRQTSEIKIGATHCLSRRLFEHETYLPGFQLEFHILSPGLNPFIMEKHLHHFVRSNDLVQYYNTKEVFKCAIDETLAKIKLHLGNIMNNHQKITWYTAVYENWPNKHPIYIVRPYSKKAVKIDQHIWEGSLVIDETPHIQISSSQYFNDYYDLRKEEIKQRAREYYLENREKIIERVKDNYRRKKILKTSIESEQ